VKERNFKDRLQRDRERLFLCNRLGCSFINSRPRGAVSYSVFHCRLEISIKHTRIEQDCVFLPILSSNDSHMIRLKS